MLKIDVLTLFPGMFGGVLDESIIKRAQNKKLVKIKVHDLRGWSEDKHKKVDDKPYGGGPGMVMRAEPIIKAVEAAIKKIKSKKILVINFIPSAEKFTTASAKTISKKYSDISIWEVL